MDRPAHIGPSIRVKGEVTAHEPLTIAGFVDGTIDVPGHVLTMTAGSQIVASVKAQSIVLAGTLSGPAVADERIIVQDTATIDGDLTAPKVAVNEGASVRGRIETAARVGATRLRLAS
jgi:cytoskeletal protein CcmA (bactofilin family)